MSYQCDVHLSWSFSFPLYTKCFYFCQITHHSLQSDGNLEQSILNCFIAYCVSTVMLFINHCFCTWLKSFVWWNNYGPLLVTVMCLSQKFHHHVPVPTFLFSCKSAKNLVKAQIWKSERKVEDSENSHTHANSLKFKRFSYGNFYGNDNNRYNIVKFHCIPVPPLVLYLPLFCEYVLLPFFCCYWISQIIFCDM
jgi:hypothetical protein